MKREKPGPQWTLEEHYRRVTIGQEVLAALGTKRQQASRRHRSNSRGPHLELALVEVSHRHENMKHRRIQRSHNTGTSEVPHRIFNECQVQLPRLQGGLYVLGVLEYLNLDSKFRWQSPGQQTGNSGSRLVRLDTQLQRSRVVRV